MYELHQLLRDAVLPAMHDDEFHGDPEAVERLGLFFYDFEEYSLGGVPVHPPYGLTHRPNAPLHIDRLPPRLRDQLKSVRMDKVRFPDSERVQPVEHVACTFWRGDHELAYLAADGVTVRPVPGREAQFAGFCEELQRDYPEEIGRFRFEGADTRHERG